MSDFETKKDMILGWADYSLDLHAAGLEQMVANNDELGEIMIIAEEAIRNQRLDFVRNAIAEVLTN